MLNFLGLVTFYFGENCLSLLFYELANSLHISAKEACLFTCFSYVPEVSKKKKEKEQYMHVSLVSILIGDEITFMYLISISYFVISNCFEACFI